MMHDDPSDEELNRVSNRSANTRHITHAYILATFMDLLI